MEEYRSNVFEMKVMRKKYSDITETKHQDAGENCIIRTFVILNLHQVAIELSER
jgi:hypothetical protein